MRAGILAVAVVLAAIAAAAFPSEGAAQSGQKAAVVLILDASKSMNDDDGTGQPKLAAAKAAMTTLIDSLPDDAQVGLRVYGSQVSGSGRAAGCADTEQVVPVGPLNRGVLKQRVAAIQARGFTPIAGALRAAAQDLPDQGQNTIVLVSDGGDNCAPPSPCSVAGQLARQGLELRIQAVGFQVKERARRQLQCIADKGKGRYVDAGDAQELGTNLRTITARALRGYRTRGSSLPGWTAPNLARPAGAGQYLSRIDPGETRWYAFSVGAGQGLRVNVTVPTNAPGGAPDGVEAEMEDESLDYADSESDSSAQQGILSATVVNDPVREDDLRNPPRGVQYVKVTVNGSSAPVPIEIVSVVSGQAPKAVARTHRAPSAAPEAGEVSDLVLLLSSGAALVVGAFGGIGLARALGSRA